MLSRDCILYIFKFLPYNKRLSLRVLSKKHAEIIKDLHFYLFRVPVSMIKDTIEFIANNVSYLNIDFFNIKDIMSYDFILGNIKKLTIDCFIHHETGKNIYNILFKFKNLESLELINIDIKNGDLAGVPNLKKLKVKGAGEFCVSGNVKYLSNLEYLQCKNVEQDLNALTSVKTLKLVGSEVKLQQIKDLPLKKLILINTYEIYDLNCFTKLESLTIEGITQLTNASIRDLNLKYFTLIKVEDKWAYTANYSTLIKSSNCPVFKLTHMTNLCLIKSNYFVIMPRGVKFVKLPSN